MNKLSNLQGEVLDILSRINRLNELIEMHQEQTQPDLLVIDSYKRLQEQYLHQLEDLLATLNLNAHIQLKAA